MKGITYMLYFLTLVITTITSVGLYFSSFAEEIVTLDKGNYTSIRKEITEESMNDVIKDVLSSKKNKPFYIYIDSPGGDAFAAFRVVEVLKNASNVICVSNKAISAAYLITQACPQRYVTETSTFMWHSVQSQVAGSTEEMENSVRLSRFIQTLSDEIIAKKLGITIEELTSRKTPEYWTVGGNALITTHQADRIVTVTCSPEATKEQITEKVQTSFLAPPEEITKSACPL